MSRRHGHRTAADVGGRAYRHRISPSHRFIGPPRPARAESAKEQAQEYFTQAVAGRDSLIGKLNTANHQMLEGQAELVDGTARFIGPRKVAVDTADGELIITAQTVVLGTGAVPARPDIPGIDLPRVYDSTTIQHADPLPQRLAIIGGGFIGLEFAQMFQHFGSQVTVVDSGEQFLRRAEPVVPVVAESVHQALTKSGVLVRQSARVQQIRQDGEALTLELADGQVQADGGVLEPLPPLMADEDVVGAPLRAELLADGGELSDQLPQRLVVRRPACLGPQQGDGGGGTGLPVDEEVPRTGIQEVVARKVRPPASCGRTVELGRMQGPAQRLHAEHIQAPVADEGCREGDQVEHPLHLRQHRHLPAPRRLPLSRPGGAGEVEQIGALVVVQAQSLGDGSQD
jgi:hypothetical protein